MLRLVTVYQCRALAANAECIPQQHPSHHLVGTGAPLAPLFEILALSTDSVEDLFAKVAPRTGHRDAGEHRASQL